MKTKIWLFIIPLILSGMISCEKDLKVYNQQVNRINFLYEGDEGDPEALDTTRTSIINYSFILADTEEDVDTIWITVRTIGFVTNINRPVSIEQVPLNNPDSIDAVTGVHYEGLNSALHYVPAGRATARLPIIVYNNPSIEEEIVYLHLRLKPNEYFQSGLDIRQEMLITITGGLTKPRHWTDYAVYTFGEWGVEKHRFMIESLGVAIDDDWFYSQGYDADLVSETNSGVDISRFQGEYVVYLGEWLQNKLDQANAERGYDLTEKDGTIVSFP